MKDIYNCQFNYFNLQQDDTTLEDIEDIQNTIEEEEEDD